MSGDPRWSVEQCDGITVARSGTLRGIAGVVHGFSTRLGPGGTEFDLGPATAGPALPERTARLEAALGLEAGSILLLRQVHGARVVPAGDVRPGSAPDGDAIIARHDWIPARSPAVRTADCVPILIADLDGRAVAAVHAGWRGTAASVARRAVEALVDAGVAPERLRAAVGPAIGACCYEVGAEVLEPVARASGARPDEVSHRGSGGRTRLDLKRANRLQLEAAGLSPGAVDVAPWCTGCAGELFFSHRREGSRAGRMLACVGFGRSRSGSP